MITEHAAVREAALRLSAKESAARGNARCCTPDGRAYSRSSAAENDKGKARQRSLRWLELGWEVATTAAREEARKEVVLEMLRALIENFRRGMQAQVDLARWETAW